MALQLTQSYIIERLDDLAKNDKVSISIFKFLLKLP
jgi:hypothetical protein